MVICCFNQQTTELLLGSNKAKCSETLDVLVMCEPPWCVREALKVAIAMFRTGGRDERASDEYIWFNV